MAEPVPNTTRPNSRLVLPRCAKNERKRIASSCLSTASRLGFASPTRSSVSSRRRSHSPFANLTSTHAVDAEMCRIAIASNLDLAKQLGTVVQGTVKPSAFFSPSDRIYSNPHSDHAVLYTRTVSTGQVPAARRRPRQDVRTTEM